jgi:UPF0271 protein
MILNIDAGELDDEPEELYAIADLLNVACGGHAGDERSMERLATACARYGTRLGAHPSYVDRDGFGRREIAIASDLLADQITAQCRRLAAVAGAKGVEIAFAKPHGALYHAANRSGEIARACVEGVRAALGKEVAIVGPAGGELARAAGERFLREAFADRGVRPDGSLVPRGEPGALVTDPALAAARARELAVKSDVDTICIHGDTPGAVEIARAVRAALGPR